MRLRSTPHPGRLRSLRHSRQEQLVRLTHALSAGRVSATKSPPRNGTKRGSLVPGSSESVRLPSWNDEGLWLQADSNRGTDTVLKAVDTCGGPIPVTIA